MRIVTPSVEVVFHQPVDSATMKVWTHQTFLEWVGRKCYKSEDKITATSASKFIRMLRDRGHHAMLEHGFASAYFVMDRGVSHELVRHRLASFAQESTRYCSYDAGKFDAQITVIEPPFTQPGAREVWEESCRVAEHAYMRLRELGEPAQLARSVLPTCLKTEIVISANFREWMHIFSLRCAHDAHPQMVSLMKQVQSVFQQEIPELFDDQEHETKGG